MDMTTLERRLEEATGPSRELDWAIADATGYFDAFERVGYDRHNFDDDDLPRYTSSLDAAVALVKRVLPGWCWRVATCSVSDDAWLFPDFNHPVHGEGFTKRWPDCRDPVEYFGTDIDQRPPGNPALALCKSLVIALRAIKDSNHV